METWSTFAIFWISECFKKLLRARKTFFFDEIDSIMFDQTLMEMKQLVLIEAALLQIFFSIVAALLFVVSVLFLQPLLTPWKLEKVIEKHQSMGSHQP